MHMKKLIAVFAVGTALLVGMNIFVYGQAKKKPVKIGMVADKTGGLAAYGYSHEKTVRAAIARINKEGGIAGRQVELYVEDTESKPSVGALKFRKLVETTGVDFVLDSNSSGVAIACAPIAKELKVPYFPCVSATEVAAEKGNRYVFQASTNVREEVTAAAKYAVSKIGRKWVTVVVNYAWGWSNEQDFTKAIKENGGTVLESVRVPLGTSDWLPYLKGKIPKEAEAVFFANFGSDFLSFIRDLYAVRPDIKKLGAVYALSAQDIKALGAPAEGAYCITPFPARFSGLPTKADRAFRQLLGVDDDGREAGTGTRFVLAYNWAMWETMFVLKNAIEKTGWQGKDDTPKLIKAIEGMHWKESADFPQGDGYFRAQDHLAIVGLYIEHVAKGELQVVDRIPSGEGAYAPLADFTKEQF
jgi:branched-chain amino acid transport system substrate-binding protein